MRKVILTAMAFCLLCGMVSAQSFTDLGKQHERKTGLADLVSIVNSNFARIEDGNYDGGSDTLTVNGAATFKNTVTAISTNGATTNVIITVNGAVDGETIADDTIDDDSIDFSDVTGADLTLTDSTAITASGDITANGNLIGDGSTVVTNMGRAYIGIGGWLAMNNVTQLVFISANGATTNVIDADVTN